MTLDEKTSFLPRDARRNSAMDADNDTKTLATVYEGDEYFDANEPNITQSMSRSRTIEEHDYHHSSFKPEDAIDAQQAPRRHNIIFISLFVCFFAAAMIGKGLQGRVMAADYRPCDFGSSQKRDENGEPRKDLLNNCQNLSLWPETAQPTTTSDLGGYPSEKVKPRWEGTYSNGTTTATGPQSYGNGLGGATEWGPPEIISTAASSTIGRSDETKTTGPASYGTGMGVATTWGPPETIGTTFRTMLYPTGNNTSNGTNVRYGPPFNPNTEAWDGDCHAQPDRKVGDPESCHCFSTGTSAASKEIMNAVESACQYFSLNSLGPAGDDRKQVFASNYHYDDPKVPGHKGRILLKMEYWGDANGNDINQRPNGPCLIFKTSYKQCRDAFESLMKQCNILGRPDYPLGYGGYGMDSCVMWTIDLDPLKHNIAMPDQIDGKSNYWMGVNPARAPESSQSTYTWTPNPAKRTYDPTPKP